MRRGKFNIVIGGQAGSEAKGKLSAFLAAKFHPDIISMSASPNAGHTVVMGGEKFVSYHLPISWVGHKDAKILLGPTSVINLPILQDEMFRLGVPQDSIVIHPRAVMIRPHYLFVEREEGLLKLGSTNQGVGVARREKLMRVPDITFAGDVPEISHMIGDTVSTLNRCLKRHLMVLHEMTQGFDLCLEHGIDRHYCTSKMVTPAAAMAEAGVPPTMCGAIYGVIRPYPIRVNNRAGSSGPYAESPEITWEDVTSRCGSPIPLHEITTTTKLPRRVFEFSWNRIRHFAAVCSPHLMCLQFANYIDHNVYKATQLSSLTPAVLKFMASIQFEVAPVAYVGTGPDHLHMIDRGLDG